jgi:23S rRNA pseudouridine955/2504/2580 synthase
MTQRSSKRAPKSQIGTVTKEEDAFIRSLLIYEDAEILVFNKPSGLAVQGGSGVKVDMDRLMWAFANRKGRRPKLVHRLDRETSGVLVVAKTTPAAAHLSAQFADRSTSKVYLALTSGARSIKEGIIDVPLLRYTSAGIDLVRTARMDEAGAQSAQTAWRVVASSDKASLIEAIPHTGRMHQIRAHLADMGHAIAGDTKYGGLFSIGAVIIPRLMLHASKLSFTHPMTFEKLTFEAPLPQDFAAVLDQLGLSSTT